MASLLKAAAILSFMFMIAGFYVLRYEDHPTRRFLDDVKSVALRIRRALPW